MTLKRPNTEIPHKNKLPSLLHINTCSLKKNLMTLIIFRVALKNGHNSNSKTRIPKLVSLSKII